jgi:hypothetical protein
MLKTYRGGCHCGAVKFEAELDLTQSSYRCNCSICRRTRFWPAVARPEGFRLLSGEADLTQYLFNTRKNQHYFCRHCGCARLWRGHGDAHGCDVRRQSRLLDDVSEEDLSRVPITYVDGATTSSRRPSISLTCEQHGIRKSPPSAPRLHLRHRLPLKHHTVWAA